MGRHVFGVRRAARPARRADQALRDRWRRRAAGIAAQAGARAVAGRWAVVGGHAGRVGALRSEDRAQHGPADAGSAQSPRLRHGNRRCCAIAMARCGTPAPRGLYRFGAGGGAERIAEGAVRSLAFDRDGRLWVGRPDGLYPPARRRPRACCACGRATDDEANTDVRAIVQAPDRRLWIAVFGDGVRRLDPPATTSKRCAKTGCRARCPKARSAS